MQATMTRPMSRGRGGQRPSFKGIGRAVKYLTHYKRQALLPYIFLIIVTFLLLPVFGFSIGFGLFAAVTMRVMAKHRWIGCTLTAIGIAIGIRFVFAHWLSIPLPTGIVGW